MNVFLSFFLQSAVYILMHALKHNYGGRRLRTQLLMLQDVKLCKQTAHCNLYCHLPHKTKHTEFLQTFGHTCPPPHPHEWCTFLEGIHLYVAPSSWEPPGWRSFLALPCRNSLQAPAQVFQVLQYYRDRSVPNTEVYCCSVSEETPPIFHLKNIKDYCYFSA